MRPGFDGRVLVRSAHGAQVAFPARMVLSGLTDSGVSPLCGAGLLRFASSRCQRTSVSPLTGCHPSREHGQAGGAGGDDDNGLLPCPGIAGLNPSRCA